jgi:hypothetical protein
MVFGSVVQIRYAYTNGSTRDAFFIYATCPSCRHNVKISENKIESPQSLQLSRAAEAGANTPGVDPRR